MGTAMVTRATTRFRRARVAVAATRGSCGSFPYVRPRSAMRASCERASERSCASLATSTACWSDADAASSLTRVLRLARMVENVEAATRAVLASSVAASCRLECLALRSSVKTSAAIAVAKDQEDDERSPGDGQSAVARTKAAFHLLSLLRIPFRGSASGSVAVPVPPGIRAARVRVAAAGVAVSISVATCVGAAGVRIVAARVSIAVSVAVATRVGAARVRVVPACVAVAIPVPVPVAVVSACGNGARARRCRRRAGRASIARRGVLGDGRLLRHPGRDVDVRGRRRIDRKGGRCRRLGLRIRHRGAGARRQEAAGAAARAGQGPAEIQPRRAACSR